MNELSNQSRTDEWDIAKTSADEPGRAAGGSGDGVGFAFDVSDLLTYFPHNRTPTGIQRVQMETIIGFLQGDRVRKVHLCRFLQGDDRWVEVSIDLFLELCSASKQGVDAQSKDWLDAYGRLDADSRKRLEISFVPHAILVNLGSSWGIKNYSMCIRYLKSKSNIRYVPFVHDVIPARVPQLLDGELVENFVTWLIGVIENADYFLANSNATKDDLIDLAATMGREILPDQVGVVPLDVRPPEPAPAMASQYPPILRKYVLFVSTLEPRKNQLGALDAWRSLINEYGLQDTPQLVLVGKQGFQGHRVAERLRQDEALQKRVTVLSGVDDEQLADLYRGCLFTLYPSTYEGWGLPVTESLCYGKVPLISDSSSLPEAGGRFAVSFAKGSGSELLAQLRKLIFDDSYREGIEQGIRRDFRPRSWEAIAAQVQSLMAEWAGRSDGPSDWLPPVAYPGYYYPIVRGRARSVWKGMGSAEAFRQGINWWELEDWGCWSKPAGGGLQMRVAAEGVVRLALELRGLPNADADIEIRSDAGNVLGGGFLRCNAEKWFFIEISPADGAIDLRLISSGVGLGHGDPRRLGVGIKGFFIIDQAKAGAREAFIEAAALGGLHDSSYYRRLIAN